MFINQGNCFRPISIKATTPWTILCITALLKSLLLRIAMGGGPSSAEKLLRSRFQAHSGRNDFSHKGVPELDSLELVGRWQILFDRSDKERNAAVLYLKLRLLWTYRPVSCYERVRPVLIDA
jgi:hypothetical protein